MIVIFYSRVVPRECHCLQLLIVLYIYQIGPIWCQKQPRIQLCHKDFFHVYNIYELVGPGFVAEPLLSKAAFGETGYRHHF